MKLHDIKSDCPSTEALQESTTPIHMSMLLAEVIRAGKITNMAQTLILAQMVQLFKLHPTDVTNQVLAMQYPDNALKAKYAYENPTPKQLIDDIKGLKDEDAVKLAEWCAMQLAKADAMEDHAKFRDPQMELSKWISFVSNAQK